MWFFYLRSLVCAETPFLNEEEEQFFKDVEKTKSKSLWSIFLVSLVDFSCHFLLEPAARAPKKGKQKAVDILVVDSEEEGEEVQEVQVPDESEGDEEEDGDEESEEEGAEEEAPGSVPSSHQRSSAGGMKDNVSLSALLILSVTGTPSRCWLRMFLSPKKRGQRKDPCPKSLEVG